MQTEADTSDTNANDGSDITSTMTLTYTAKVKEDVDLSPYIRDDGKAYIPYSASVRFNNDENRTASSETKYLKVAVSNDTSNNNKTTTTAPRTTTTTAANRSSTPKTSDQTMGVTAIVVAALAVLGIGVALRRRASDTRE